ncbi:MAG: sugar phosphate isomerase/epimerase [Candidatus Hydrogenedentes bacterium]|nr:sugar phosphate isomerase/epimerase [Candidatus Hydrogenedentota bacterium]
MSEIAGHRAETSGSSRREFMGHAVLAGAVGSVAVQAAEAGAAGQPGVPWDSNGRMGIGINLEYVRHGDKSLAYGIKRAGELGYKWVEPCFLDGRCLLANAGYCHVTSFDTDPKVIQDMCAEAGVQISGLSSHSDLLNPEYGVLYARRGIRYARALGVKVVQICEDMHPPKWIDEAEAFNMMRINLRAISETCEENGVCIAIEQHGPYTANVERMQRILSLVDSPWIKCNYDCGNTFLAGSDPYEMLEAVIDKVVHVHAKDISVKQAEAERGKVTGTAVGCACGDGVIDWKRLVTRLNQAGYKGVLSVECGTEDEAARSLAHMTKVMQDLGA